ncbi:MAG: hypothetical protein LBD23_16155 [Oscillospiraceae bacterium]|jgi:hypothetical protein|nr:hypothetical protein [Oscillospiraceae bacterium]
MSKKYHILPDGTVGECKANIRSCPYGGEHFDSPELAQKTIDKKKEEARKIIELRKYEKNGVHWDYYDKITKLNKKYLLPTGEGETIATQTTTAVNKLVYKWYNDGDVFDNTANLKGWANDLSSYANWLYKHKPETQPILDRIYEINTKNQYEILLKDLTDTLMDKQKLSDDDIKQKISSVYKEDGNFRYANYCEDCGEETDGGAQCEDCQYWCECGKNTFYEDCTCDDDLFSL